jgi:ABC-2 type transport system permease protein
MKTSWQRSLTYKINFMLSSVLNVLRVVAEIIFWAVFFQNSGKGNISGYTLPMMITYYMLMYMVNTLVDMGEVGNSMADDIKSGTLTQYMVKPMNYLGYYFSEILSKRLFSI